MTDVSAQGLLKAAYLNEAVAAVPLLDALLAKVAPVVEKVR
jgi:hypothetical protein